MEHQADRTDLPHDSIGSPRLTPRIAVIVRRVAPVILAAATWVSLSPYFVWGSVWWSLAGGAVAALVAGACWAVGARPSRQRVELLGFALVSLFVIYITVEPRLDGGHTRWIYVLPTLLALALLSDEQRKKCLGAFAAIFAVSLLPGILDSLWLSAGFPQAFGERPVPNADMAAHGVRFLTSPWALFTESNAVLLPWGGVLFRLSGIYDEPGTVGTNAALLLIALRFRWSDWRVATLYVAGVLTFSLAFAALAALGLLGNVILRRRPVMLVAIVPIVAGASLALGWLQLSASSGTRSHIVVVQPVVQSRAVQPPQIQPSAPPPQVQPSTTPPREFAPNGPGLRQTKFVDNRSLAPMNKLFHEYLHSGPKTLLLGIASDASVVRGGGSEVWTRVLTDHGILGFCLLFGGVGLLGLAAWRRSRYALTCLLFLGLYAINIYQRPVVWLPYALLLLICGAVAASTSERDSNSGRPGLNAVTSKRTVTAR